MKDNKFVNSFEGFTVEKEVKHLHPTLLVIPVYVKTFKSKCDKEVVSVVPHV